MIDIAAVLTFHNETAMAGPTVRSAEIAIDRAEAAGLRVERWFGFDTPTPETVAWFDRSRFADWQTATHGVRDQGLLRNAMVEHSSARWIAFLDGDDLWSANWLVGAAEVLANSAATDGKTIVHPEINWVFDGDYAVLGKLPQDSPAFDPHTLCVTNPYDALGMAPREAHLAHPYRARDLANRIALEDWQFAVDTIAGGWTHAIARDTVIFKRRRTRSQMTDAADRQATIADMSALRVDRLSGLGRGSGNR